MKYARPLMLLVGLAMTSCTGKYDNDAGDNARNGDGSDDASGDGGGCTEVSRSSLGADEQLPDGAPLSELVAVAEGSHTGMLEWADPELGPATEITVSVTLDASSAMAIDQEGDPRGDTASECRDWVELGASVQISTADGKLDESFSTTGIIRGSTALDLRGEVGSVRGSLDTSLLIMEGMVFDKLDVDAKVGAEPTSGGISFHASSEGGDGMALAGSLASW